MKKLILTPKQVKIIAKVREKVGFQLVFWEDIVEGNEGEEKNITVDVKTEQILNDLITSLILFKGKLKKQEKIDDVCLLIEKLQAIEAVVEPGSN